MYSSDGDDLFAASIIVCLLGGRGEGWGGVVLVRSVRPVAMFRCDTGLLGIQQHSKYLDCIFLMHSS